MPQQPLQVPALVPQQAGEPLHQPHLGQHVGRVADVAEVYRLAFAANDRVALMLGLEPVGERLYSRRKRGR